MTNGGGSQAPQPTLTDFVSDVLAEATCQSWTYRATWEQVLGESEAARRATESWRKWGIERPGVLLRKELFGGAPARLFDWTSPPDPAIRQRYGFTYDALTHWVWSGFSFTEDEHINEWLRVGLDPNMAASILRYARRMSRNGEFNAGRLASTAKVFNDLGVKIAEPKVWMLQEATEKQIVRVHIRCLNPLRISTRLHDHLVRFSLYRKIGVWAVMMRPQGRVSTPEYGNRPLS